METILLSLFVIVMVILLPFSSRSHAGKRFQLIPRDILFGNPEKTTPKISPDGKKLAYIAPFNDVLNIWIKTIGKEDDRAVTRDDHRGVMFYFWAHDSEKIMYFQDKEGDENWNIYRVNLETGETANLTGFQNVQVRLVACDKHFPYELLIGMNRENPKLYDVYHLNLNSGELKRVAKNPGNVIGWLADPDFRVRCSIAVRPDGGFDILVRAKEGSDFKKLFSWNFEDSLISKPLGFSKDGKYIYLKESRNANTSQLVQMNIADQSITVLAKDPQYDTGRVLIHPDTYQVQAVSFFKAREEWMVLDHSLEKDFQAIAEIDQGDFQIYNRDDRDRTWVVCFTKDNGPEAFYAYDRSTRRGTFLFHDRPLLQKYALAPMTSITFEARDGVIIHGYLTCPPGRNGKNPLVLNVHGGPWSRDIWGYNPEAQWLANRGYCCLQINFRGSAGYGKDFLNAGDKEWGGKMQDDLIDSVKWAVKEGIADAKRLAIYGASYGGFAALAGVTFTPDLFRCAVDMFGPSNLITWLENIPPYWASYRPIFENRIGSPRKDKTFLEARSPFFKIDQIKIPILIAQGANDPRVKKSESDQIIEAIRKKGIDYEYLVFPDEGHGFLRHENRLKFYDAAEAFLSKHLGGRYLPEEEKQ